MLTSSPSSAGGGVVAAELVELSSGLTLSGVPFQSRAERDLWPELRVAAAKIRSGPATRTLAIAECALPVGVPDLALFRFRDEALNDRLRSGLTPVVAEADARVVAACTPRRGQQLESVARVAGLPEPRARRILSLLAAAGVVESHTDGWRRAAAAVPVADCYALEAKVNDWRKGLWQCLRYESYAGASGLVLGNVGDRALEAAVARAQELGVGLFARGRWLRRPRLQILPAWKRLLTSERLVAAVLGDQGEAGDPPAAAQGAQ